MREREKERERNNIYFLQTLLNKKSIDKEKYRLIKHINSNKQTDRQTDTYRQTDIHTYRHTYIQIDIHTCIHTDRQTEGILLIPHPLQYIQKGNNGAIVSCWCSLMPLEGHWEEGR